MSHKKKSQPVVCSNCGHELQDYRELADAIRSAVGEKTGKYVGRTLKRIAELNPFKTVRNLNKLADNVAARRYLSGLSRREVLNLAELECPECGDFHEWKRLS
jgi:predicted RNA-binding Zn-ribbon protein involved in translation (DUF1610 family)